MPFARIRSIRYKLVRVVGGAATYNRGYFRVRLDDGTIVAPTMQLESMDDVIGHVAGHAEPLLIDGMIAAIRSGQTVHAGPLELRPEGVVLKGRSVSWERASLSSSGSSTHAQLLDVDPEEGEYEKVGEVKLDKIDNAHAVESLVERLRAEAIRAR